MADFKRGRLVEAVRSNDKELVLALLTDGAPVDDVDQNGDSALIVAVWEYNADLIQVLLQHGADANFAAAKNKRPLTAHPNITKRMVNLLLKAGADPMLKGQHGSVLAEIARSSTKRVLQALFDAGFNLHVEGKQRERFINELTVRKSSNLSLVLEHWKIAPTMNSRQETDRNAQLKLWSKTSGSQEFKTVVCDLEKRLDRTCCHWKRRKSVQQIPKVQVASCLSNIYPDASTHDGEDNADVAERLVRQLSSVILSRGFVLLANDLLFDDSFSLLLFPTQDKYAVLAAIGTNGANYGNDSDDVIRWLQQMEQENPFYLYAATHDGLEGAFTHPLKNSTDLATRMLKFCPDIDCGDGSADHDEIETFAADLESSRCFTFWWD